MTQARRDKEANSELVAAERCLVVVTLETEGQWSAEAFSFSEEMAQLGERRTVPAAQIRSVGMEDAVDQNVVGLLRQVVRLFLGCRSARRDVGGRWSDTSLHQLVWVGVSACFRAHGF